MADQFLSLTDRQQLAKTLSNVYDLKMGPAARAAFLETAGLGMVVSVEPVSYTHLDVYKRQDPARSWRAADGAPRLPGRRGRGQPAAGADRRAGRDGRSGAD